MLKGAAVGGITALAVAAVLDPQAAWSYIRSVGDWAGRDVAAGAYGLAHTILGVGRGIRQIALGVYSYSPDLVKTGVVSAIESLVLRYGYNGGPGHARNPTDKWFNSLDRTYHIHDYGTPDLSSPYRDPNSSATFMQFDTGLLRDMWTLSEQPFLYGQFYRAGASIAFGLKLPVNLWLDRSRSAP